MSSTVTEERQVKSGGGAPTKLRTLFFLRGSEYLAMFESLVLALLARGHEVLVALDPERRGLSEDTVRLLDGIGQGRAGFRYQELPPRTDIWRIPASAVRRGLDYLRYLEPGYAGEEQLRAAARERAPRLLLALLFLPPFRWSWGRAAVRWLLTRLDAAMPIPRWLRSFIAEQRPDVVLLSPLVDFGSTQADYLRRAQAQRIPSVLLVAGPDDLRAKGGIREVPTLTVVSSDEQVDEAVRLQGLPRDRVVAVAGGPQAPKEDGLVQAIEGATPKDVVRNHRGVVLRPFLWVLTPLLVLLLPLVAPRATANGIRNWRRGRQRSRVERRRESEARTALERKQRGHAAKVEAKSKADRAKQEAAAKAQADRAAKERAGAAKAAKSQAAAEREQEKRKVAAAREEKAKAAAAAREEKEQGAVAKQEKAKAEAAKAATAAAAAASAAAGETESEAERPTEVGEAAPVHESEAPPPAVGKADPEKAAAKAQKAAAKAAKAAALAGAEAGTATTKPAKPAKAKPDKPAKGTAKPKKRPLRKRLRGTARSMRRGAKQTRRKARRTYNRRYRFTYAKTIHRVPARDELPALLNARGLLGKGVEIGVKTGKYSDELLRNWRGEQLISVDPWMEAEWEEYVDRSNVAQGEQDRNYEITREKLAVHGERSDIWRLTSVEAARKVKPQSLDFAYIDARHDYESVKEDIAYWCDKVRPGGIIAGHDYVDGDFEEGEFYVKSAVDEFFGERGIPVHGTEGPSTVEAFPTWIVEVPEGGIEPPKDRP